MNNKIAKIEKLKTLFEQASILPELAVELRFRATVESVHSSTSIEGNPLSKIDVQQVLQEKPVRASEYAIQEVINYKNAMMWLDEPQNSQIISTQKQILTLHKLVMKDLLPAQKIGSFRPADIYIVDQINGKEIVQYTGPDAGDLQQLVNSFLKWIVVQKNMALLHPVLLSGLIHYIFVSIHPFSDGNGRTTRLLTQQYLKSENYDFNSSLSLETYYLAHRSKYYEALSRGKTFEDRMFADITPFLEFFLDGFLDCATQVSRYVQVGKILDVHEKPIRLNKEELLIIDYIYQFESASLEETLDITRAKKRTVQRRLSELVSKGILKRVGNGRAGRYFLDG